MGVISVNKDNFKKEVLENKTLTLIDFYAEWCGPCQMVGPILEEIAKEMKNVKFVKINVDESPELASQYSVFSIPTFLIFKGGKNVAQFAGVRSKEDFLEEIKNLI